MNAIIRTTKAHHRCALRNFYSMNTFRCPSLFYDKQDHLTILIIYRIILHCSSWSNVFNRASHDHGCIKQIIGVIRRILDHLQKILSSLAAELFLWMRK